MKITYRIKQYDVDKIKITITSPEYLDKVCTKIHSPHFLLSELQHNIEINLTKNIHKFCNKHKRYADILCNKQFVFEPDKFDREYIHENSCWFYTNKFIDDTRIAVSDEGREEIYYENYRRYINQSESIYYLKMNREGKNKPIVFQMSCKDRPIDANELIKYFGIKKSEIKFWNSIQRDWCPTGGHNKNNVYFPRYIKKGGRNIYTIREINKYFSNIFKYNRPKYDFFVGNFKKRRQSAF